MRKFWLLCLLLLLAEGSVSKAFAVQTVSFSVPEVQCEPNRLVQIPCVANGAGKLCAAAFRFRFDNSLLEIREVKPCTGAKAVFHQTDILTLSFVHADGIDLSASPVIFTLTCKAASEGTTPVSFEVFDCVDGNVEFMQIGACKSGSVTVAKDVKTTSGSSSAADLPKLSGASSGAAGGSAAKSSSPGETEKETTAPTVPVTEEKQRASGDPAVAIAVLAASVIGGMLFFSWLIPKRIKERRVKTKPPSEDADKNS